MFDKNFTASAHNYKIKEDQDLQEMKLMQKTLKKFEEQSKINLTKKKMNQKL